MSGTILRTCTLNIVDGGVEQPAITVVDPDTRDWNAAMESQIPLSAGGAPSAVVLPATPTAIFIQADVPLSLVITAGLAATVTVPLPPGVLPGEYHAVDLPFTGVTALTIQNTHATLDGTAHVWAFGS